MDIAAMSVVMAGNSLRSDTSIAITNNAKNVMEQQGKQRRNMLQQSGTKGTTSNTWKRRGYTNSMKMIRLNSIAWMSLKEPTTGNGFI